MKKIWFYIPKNCKNWALTIVVLILPASFIFGSDNPKNSNSADSFKTEMGAKYNEAISYIVSNAWISDSLKANGIDPAFALAIVFPEIVRYSWLRDKMETTGLFSLYVQYGDKYADFSVGRFQMKPTFACRLEQDAISLGLFSKSTINKFGENGDTENRLERVKRLDNPMWQVRYLIAFIKVMEKRTHLGNWTSIEEKVKYYATAYNFGYWQTEQKIKKYVKVRSFYTTLTPGEVYYCYASISCSYYRLIHKVN